MKDEEKFSAFLFETMPFVAKLADVTFESNNVQSFQPIVQRLGNVTPPGRLRILNLERFRERRGYWLVRLSTNENINRARTSDTPRPGWKEELRKRKEKLYNLSWVRIGNFKTSFELIMKTMVLEESLNNCITWKLTMPAVCLWKAASNHRNGHNYSKIFSRIRLAENPGKSLEMAGNPFFRTSSQWMDKMHTIQSILLPSQTKV